MNFSSEELKNANFNLNQELKFFNQQVLKPSVDEKGVFKNGFIPPKKEERLSRTVISKNVSTINVSKNCIASTGRSVFIALKNEAFSCQIIGNSIGKVKNYQRRMPWDYRLEYNCGKNTENLVIQYVNYSFSKFVEDSIPIKGIDNMERLIDNQRFYELNSEKNNPDLLKNISYEDDNLMIICEKNDFVCTSRITGEVERYRIPFPFNSFCIDHINRCLWFVVVEKEQLCVDCYPFHGYVSSGLLRFCKEISKDEDIRAKAQLFLSNFGTNVYSNLIKHEKAEIMKDLMNPQKDDNFENEVALASLEISLRSNPSDFDVNEIYQILDKLPQSFAAIIFFGNLDFFSRSQEFSKRVFMYFQGANPISLKNYCSKKLTQCDAMLRFDSNILFKSNESLEILMIKNKCLILKAASYNKELPSQDKEEFFVKFHEYIDDILSKSEEKKDLLKDLIRSISIVDERSVLLKVFNFVKENKISSEAEQFLACKLVNAKSFTDFEKENPWILKFDEDAKTMLNENINEEDEKILIPETVMNQIYSTYKTRLISHNLDKYRVIDRLSLTVFSLYSNIIEEARNYNSKNISVKLGAALNKMIFIRRNSNSNVHRRLLFLVRMQNKDSKEINLDSLIKFVNETTAIESIKNLYTEEINAIKLFNQLKIVKDLNTLNWECCSLLYKCLEDTKEIDSVLFDLFKHLVEFNETESIENFFKNVDNCSNLAETFSDSFETLKFKTSILGPVSERVTKFIKIFDREDLLEFKANIAKKVRVPDNELINYAKEITIKAQNSSYVNSALNLIFESIKRFEYQRETYESIFYPLISLIGCHIKDMIMFSAAYPIIFLIRKIILSTNASNVFKELLTLKKQEKREDSFSVIGVFAVIGLVLTHNLDKENYMIPPQEEFYDLIFSFFEIAKSNIEVMFTYVYSQTLSHYMTSIDFINKCSPEIINYVTSKAVPFFFIPNDFKFLNFLEKKSTNLKSVAYGPFTVIDNDNASYIFISPILSQNAHKFRLSFDKKNTTKIGIVSRHTFLYRWYSLTINTCQNSIEVDPTKRLIDSKEFPAGEAFSVFVCGNSASNPTIDNSEGIFDDSKTIPIIEFDDFQKQQKNYSENTIFKLKYLIESANEMYYLYMSRYNSLSAQFRTIAFIRLAFRLKKCSTIFSKVPNEKKMELFRAALTFLEPFVKNNQFYINSKCSIWKDHTVTTFYEEINDEVISVVTELMNDDDFEPIFTKFIEKMSKNIQNIGSVKGNEINSRFELNVLIKALLFSQYKDRINIAKIAASNSGSLDKSMRSLIFNAAPFQRDVSAEYIDLITKKQNPGYDYLFYVKSPFTEIPKLNTEFSPLKRSELNHTKIDHVILLSNLFGYDMDKTDASLRPYLFRIWSMIYYSESESETSLYTEKDEKEFITDCDAFMSQWKVKDTQEISKAILKCNLYLTPITLRMLINFVRDLPLYKKFGRVAIMRTAIIYCFIWFYKDANINFFEVPGFFRVWKNILNKEEVYAKISGDLKRTITFGSKTVSVVNDPEEPTFPQVSKCFEENEWKVQHERPFQVIIPGNHAIDDGGVWRQLLTNTTDSIFYDDLGIVAPIQDKKEFFVPLYKESNKNYLISIGAFIGIIIRTENRQDIPFAPIVWKLLADEYVGINDFKECDPFFSKEHSEEEMSKGLLDWEGNYVKDEDYKVTDMNTYIKKCMDFKLDLLAKAVNLIKEGLYKNLEPKNPIDFIDSSSLYELVRGSQEVSFEVIEDMLVFDIPFNEELKKMLIRVLKSVTSEDLVNIYRFITGGKRIKYGISINVHELRTVDKFPEAMTCYNYLQLPHYSSDEKCKFFLLYAANNCLTIDKR